MAILKANTSPKLREERKAAENAKAIPPAFDSPGAKSRNGYLRTPAACFF
jgi:hypothetical protein